MLTELRSPDSFVGRSLAELKLPRKYGITVVAVRREGKGAILFPDPHESLQGSDILLVVSREGAIRKLMEHV